LLRSSDMYSKSVILLTQNRPSSLLPGGFKVKVQALRHWTQFHVKRWTHQTWHSDHGPATYVQHGVGSMNKKNRKGFYHGLVTESPYMGQYRPMMVGNVMSREMQMSIGLCEIHEPHKGPESKLKGTTWKGKATLTTKCTSWGMRSFFRLWPCKGNYFKTC